jgi:hypothetical protein
MNTFKTLLAGAVVAGLTFSIAGCNNEDDPIAVVSTTYKDLNADYAPYESPLPTDRPPIRVGAKNKFTLFSFETGAIVPNADSATTKWDIGFRSTTIIVNSGTSGPGTASAQVVTNTLDALTTAPDAGYKTDNKAGATAAERNAIPSGSGNGWYTYTAASNLIAPIAGRVIVVKTSSGRYAKMEILSYYKGAPATPSPEPAGADKDRYYTFRYVYQPNDTKSFN